jgi:hypothetical protein
VLLPYEQHGGDYFLRREDRERVAKRFVRQLERLGHSVTLGTRGGASEVSGYF